MRRQQCKITEYLNVSRLIFGRDNLLSKRYSEFLFLPLKYLSTMILNLSKIFIFLLDIYKKGLKMFVSKDKVAF